jgi:signal transduction histidine kinase
MAALGRFSAGAAHEIKNPLGIILGGMEYLQAKFRDADDESKDTIKMVSSAVLRVDSIINALTELAGPAERKVRKIDTKTMVEDAILLLGSKLKGCNITFSTVAEKNLFIEADIDHIQYALLSILTNAADAMPGGGEVKTKVYRHLPDRPSPGGSKCVIEIADTGEGISEDALSKVFEPFFTTRRDKKQIGLGLTVAKEFIGLNKGDIGIASKKGEGTVVKISFPMAT